MELRVLRYFLAVASEGNISRAANVLHLTQPTLSRQIADLEQRLGRTFFERHSHSVELTREGMLFRQRAEEIVGLADKVEAEFKALGKTVAGDVHIGAGESQHMRTIAAAIRQVRGLYPGIRFHIFSGNKELVAERLARGVLDFGVLVAPVDSGRHHFLPLPGKEVWGLLSPPGSLPDDLDIVTREDVRRLPLILSRRIMQQVATGSSVAKWFGGDVANLNVVATYNLMNNAALLAEEGVGHVVGWANLALSVATGRLRFRPFSPALESGLAVVWRKNHALSQAAAIFLDCLKDRVADAA